MENGIYTLIPKKQLEAVLKNLNEYTELPVLLLDADGNLLMSFGKSAAYCTVIKKKVFSDKACQEAHKKAGIQAQQLGESYIFCCHASLNHIAFPLVCGSRLLGSAIIGPFLMDKPDSTLVSDIAESNRLSPVLSLELYDELGGINIISPKKVGQLSVLINNLLSPLLAQKDEMLASRDKLRQQAHIAESIQHYKEQEVSESCGYLFERENLLLQKARDGDIEAVKGLMNDLLGYVFFSEGGKQELVRVRAAGFTALLARVAAEEGASTEQVATLNERYNALLAQNRSVEDLCYLMQQVAEGFIAAMFRTSEQENRYIRRAIRFVTEHYSEELPLKRTASAVGLSPNYLSALFRESTGMKYKDYVNDIRIEAACRLLNDTDCPLAEIALGTGFSDQSTFCKCFRRLKGISPGQYRRYTN